MKPRIVYSFSGGRSSAKMVKDNLPTLRDTHEVLVVFANTSREDERTLQFVEQCDRAFSLSVVWLEAVFHQRRGCGTTHRVVDFRSASRDGAVFEAGFAKFGIPNKHYPWCTRELKQRPIYSYLRSIGWKRSTYKVAIGYRADEIDRMPEDRSGFIYPLADEGVTEADVLHDWEQQPFNLYLPRHHGNCKTCHKKSDRKLFTLALEDPGAFNFNFEADRRYALAGPGHDAATPNPRRFFRKGRSTAQLLAEAFTTPFEPYIDDRQAFDPELDEPGGCSESCEPWSA